MQLLLLHVAAVNLLQCNRSLKIIEKLQFKFKTHQFIILVQLRLLGIIHKAS